MKGCNDVLPYKNVSVMKNLKVETEFFYVHF